MSILPPGANCSNFVCTNKTRCVVNEFDQGLGCFLPVVHLQEYTVPELILWGFIKLCSAFTMLSLAGAAVLLVISCLYACGEGTTFLARKYRSHVQNSNPLPSYEQAIRNSRPK
ncbi:unnamed protein product [Bursaphelenchus xylophilus]|uniref:(pine wood nematode) hypothetical protein n=1 Tax=Bursaphelenchus xylophilus TaxID=6326 RepID=A0A1I7RUM7_BURXY|nr:unnamed protein product [Bursaphelenchus xylophilus]CAG9114233.1 unnamed protein product [Bursaphelenchus xylophilus]